MAGLRIPRLSKQIQRDLGDIFIKINRDFFQGILISVTEVRLAKDLSVAKVFLSIFPSEKAEIIKEIQDMTPQIRLELGNRIRNTVRKIPELRFEIDPTLDNLEKIDNLLKKDNQNQNKNNESEQKEE